MLSRHRPSDGVAREIDRMSPLENYASLNSDHRRLPYGGYPSSLCSCGSSAGQWCHKRDWSNLSYGWPCVFKVRPPYSALWHPMRCCQPLYLYTGIRPWWQAHSFTRLDHLSYNSSSNATSTKIGLSILHWQTYKALSTLNNFLIHLPTSYTTAWLVLYFICFVL